MNIYLIFAVIVAVLLLVMLLPLWKHSSLPHAQKMSFSLIVGLLFFTGSFGLYALVGSPEIIPLLQERSEKIVRLKNTILADSQAVKTNPKDLRAWVELGQSFIETGQFNAAANAFKQAVVLSNGNPQLILAYAKAMILGDDGQVSDLAKKSLEMVLLQEPNSPDARYFLAVRELQDGHTQEAMKDMKALYHSLPADSPLKTMIDSQIGKN